MTLSTGTIRQSVFIDASPEEVYESYMNVKKHSLFTGAKATGSAKVGGRMTAWDGYITAKNLKLVKGKLIVQEWKTTEWPKGYPPSIVEITLKRKGNGTQLSVVHAMVPREQLDDYRQGWTDYYWKPLREYFASV